IASAANKPSQTHLIVRMLPPLTVASPDFLAPGPLTSCRLRLADHAPPLKSKHHENPAGGSENTEDRISAGARVGCCAIQIEFECVWSGLYAHLSMRAGGGALVLQARYARFFDCCLGVRPGPHGWSGSTS